MASKTEGIALLSMYNDEEEEEDDAVEAERGEGVEAGAEEEAAGRAEDDLKIADDGASPDAESAPEKTPSGPQSRTPVFFSEEDSEKKTLASPALPTMPTPTRTPTPKHQFFLPFMPSQSPAPAASPADAAEVRSASKRSLTIVDYAHDEMAMSPETEEGEILSAQHVITGTYLHASTGTVEERTFAAALMVTSSTQPTPPRHVGQPEESRSEANTPADVLETDQEALPVDMDVEVSATVQEELDPLSKFLPPPVTVKCSDELQEKINKFLAYKRAGKSFNTDLRNRKDYRNPNFLQHAVTYQEIDEIGTCFSKDVFDPHGYDKSDYYDAIEADMKREIERREQERKRSPKVDFIAGGTQPAIALPAQKASSQIPGVPPVAAGALQSASVAVDSVPKDGRQNKKSKWDKVDTDVKALPGQDAMSTVGVNAAMLSAANAGAGYTAFAQQKRREAEEKKSSERKFDKRS